MGKKSALEQLKYEVSEELGYINNGSPELNNANYEVSNELGIQSGFGTKANIDKQYEDYLNNAKFETAKELGIQLNEGDNGDILSRDAGRIGGRIGGKIGGNMVRKMVEYAQNHMKTSGEL
jgi:hypothetical protein